MAQEVPLLKQLLVHHLTQDPTLLELLGGPRVYTAHGRDSEEATRETGCVVIQMRGGPTLDSSPVATRTFWLWAYSARNPSEAGDVYVAARNVLRLQGLTAPLTTWGAPAFPLCAYCRETSGPIEDFNPQLTAWWSRGTWSAVTKG